MLTFQQKLAALTTHIILWRLIETVLREEGSPAMKMPNLAACSGALQQLQTEAEADAKKFLDQVEAAKTYKNTTFQRAGSAVQDLRGQLGDVNKMVSDLEQASNGGPTLGDLSPSPVKAEMQTISSADIAKLPPAANIAAPNGAGGAPATTPFVRSNPL